MCFFFLIGNNRLTYSILIVAIHEIFAQNAKKFPDRECVVETKGSQSNGRTFTYRQINESANLLAHHFLSHGCNVGDVVMIYAYRGLVLPIFFSFFLLNCLQSLTNFMDIGSSSWWPTWVLSKLVQRSAL